MRVSLLSVIAVLAAAVLPDRGATALRVAFVADTGIGNDNPGVWTDWQGNKQGYYKLNGVDCLDFAGEPCALYSRARDVLTAAKDNGAELIVHAGDMDYESAPRMWRYFVDETIRNQGMDFLAVKGNHDADGWDGVQNLWSGNPEGYAAQLRGTVPARANCRGSYGEDMVCDYGPVAFVLSSVGVEEAGEGSDTNRRHYEFLERALSGSNARWKVCVWHMNMEDMQVSYKGDSTGWGAYEICRKHGAFIVTGHAHTYSRTKQMARFGTKQWSHTKKDLRVSGNDDSRIHLHPGEEDGTSAVAVVGFGGYKNEAMLRGGKHWAKVYSTSCLDGDPVCEQASDDEKFGALLCDFPDDPGSSETECWTVTTVRPGASNRQKRRSYRNPKDRFWLIAGEDPDAGEGRTANTYSTMSSGNQRSFDGSLDRSECFDVQPQDHECILQKRWGKCDDWWLKNGGYCAKTCGRCVELLEVKEYEDYIEEKDDDDETNEAEVPASKGVAAETPDESDYMNMDEVDFYAIAEDVLEGRG